MKKLLLILFSLSFLSSCSNDKDFFLTKENALISCGGKSRIIENENEENKKYIDKTFFKRKLFISRLFELLENKKRKKCSKKGLDKANA